jgi:pyruvate/2-oxoglutarate dehydrogenase complex dihydrolipoamide dehydrogenase (E3) component
VVRLPFLPRRLVVVGAGAVGMECAHLFEGLGSEVTVVARGPSIMSGMDPDLAAELEAASVDRGMVFLKNSRIDRVAHQEGRFTLHFEGKRPKFEADALLIATGRSPVTADLGLENTGVSMLDGRILIDDHAAASKPGFFAAGDCASPVAVVHLAVLQGIVAARNAVRGIRHEGRSAPARWNPDTPMRAWFTEPQCVQIGMSEQEVEEKNIAIAQGRQEYAEHGKGMIAGARHGFVKVLIERGSGRILGASGVGPQVVETAHLMQAAIELKLTAAQYLAIPHYHPTFAEAWSRAVENAAAAILSEPPAVPPATRS